MIAIIAFVKNINFNLTCGLEKSREAIPNSVLYRYINAQYNPTYQMSDIRKGN